MLQTTAQRFGSLGKSFVSPSAAAAVIGAALLASGTTDEAETAWSPAAACLLPDVLPVAGTLLSYGGNRQLAAGGTVTHSGALNIGANAFTCGAITASGDFTFSSTSTTQKISSSRTGSVGLKLEFPDNGSDFDDGISIGSTSGEHFKISSRGLTFGNLLQTYYRVDSLATSNLLWGMSDTQHIIYGGMIGGSANPRITLNAVTHATRPNSVHFKTASGDGNFVWGFHQSLDETPVMLDIRTAAGARTDRVEWMDGGAWLTSAIDDAVDSQTAWVLRSASTLTQPNSRLLAVYNNTTDVFSVGVTGKVTASGAVQETPTQSSLNPTTTDIPSGKRMSWYNSTLSEFRDWVNIGGTLLKSAAYT